MLYLNQHNEFPLSGNVAQKWFDDVINAGAGDAKVEKKVVEVASYGRQLGLISEIIIDLANQMPPDTETGKQSLERLTAIQEEIEAVKKRIKE